MHNTSLHNNLPHTYLTVTYTYLGSQLDVFF